MLVLRVGRMFRVSEGGNLFDSCTEDIFKECWEWDGCINPWCAFCSWFPRFVLWESAGFLCWWASRGDWFGVPVFKNVTIWRGGSLG
jgi:hypothetical protein